MSAPDLIFHGWNANPVTVISLVAAIGAYIAGVGRRGQPGYFGLAVLLTAVTLLSPLNVIAQRVLFSAHMAQHIVLLLLVPALVLLSLPAGPAAGVSSNRSSASRGRTARHRVALRAAAISAWTVGIGAMWLWHTPALCDAAATRAPIRAVQVLSLLGAGTAFWWPIVGPRPAHRLPPGLAIGYLFTACLACTALGMILTLTPIDVCPVFRSPLAPGSAWASLRRTISAPHDQQIGGLLMWIPMCAVYVSAIVLELLRWLAGDPADQAVLPEKGSA